MRRASASARFVCSGVGALMLVGALALWADAHDNVRAASGATQTVPSAGEGNGGPATAPAQGPQETPPHSFVVRARLVYPVTAEQSGPIECGMVVVRDGKVAAVGRDLPIPADLPVVELRDSVVCPGCVAAASAQAGPHAGPESVSGAYRAADACDIYADNTAALARGTTTAHLGCGEHRLVSGVGAVAKLAGPAEQRILRRDADLTLTFGVFTPPPLVNRPFYASSDVAIEPATRQRPDSRAGQIVELEKWITTAERAEGTPAAPGREVARQADDTLAAAGAPFDQHTRAFTDAWRAKLPLRVQVHRATDIDGALQFLQRRATNGGGRPAYFVGLSEGGELPDALFAAGVPLVLRIERSFRAPGGDIGPDPAALEPKLATAGRLAGGKLALAGLADAGEDLRMAAILALRGGLPREQALAGITRVPAEILGVAERVGSLAPGRDADLLVLTGEPLDINAWVERV
ncbi:MAG: amidohydrolase family protein, partial [Planctomycetota bacterium]